MLLCISFILICFVLWRKMTLTQKNYKDALLNKEMQLKYLQGQINPHFLYNTLDTIRWMAVRNDQGDIAEQVKALSDVFRYTLNKGDTFTTVAREIEHVRKYMLIQQKRFEDRIEYDIDAGEDCLQLKVPNLILQPLVENAVVHGLEESTEKGRIHIRIYTKENDLYYVVEDNGVGFDEKEIRNKMNNSEQSHEVFALKNIDERLKLMYGDGYGLTFSSVLGVKSIMTIRQKINR
jgi:two-component system sensor histidine kinase YesM